MNTSSQAGIASWTKRWLGNGANLITLSRIPLLAVLIWSICGLVIDNPSAMYWWKGYTKYTLFCIGAITQVIGMIADGLDGLYARHLSEDGPTSEGQFLDQFIDKIFVWVPWWILSVIFFDTVPSLVYWYIPSVYLCNLDRLSCIEHWYKYKKNLGKEVNKKAGAVPFGKAKFVVECLIICILIAALCPSMDLPLMWDERLADNLRIVGQFVQPYAFTLVVLAIWLARKSLKQRNVLNSKSA